MLLDVLRAGLLWSTHTQVSVRACVASRSPHTLSTPYRLVRSAVRSFLMSDFAFRSKYLHSYAHSDINKQETLKEEDSWMAYRGKAIFPDRICW